MGREFSTMDAGGQTDHSVYADFTSSQRVRGEKGAFMGLGEESTIGAPWGTRLQRQWKKGRVARPFGAGNGVDFGDGPEMGDGGDFGDGGMGFSLSSIVKKVGSVAKAPINFARGLVTQKAPAPALARAAIPTGSISTMFNRINQATGLAIKSTVPATPAPAVVPKAVPAPEAGAAVPTTNQVVSAQAQTAAPSNVRVNAQFRPYVHPMALLQENAAMNGLWDDIKAAGQSTIQTGLTQAKSGLVSAGAQALTAGTQKIVGGATVQKALTQTGQQAATQAVAEKLTQTYEDAKRAGSAVVGAFEQNKKMLMIAAAAAAAGFIYLKTRKHRRATA